MTYLCKKTKGIIEVNTALMLYKSIIRSLTEYANFIYHPTMKNQATKLERAQFLGIRTALGYRNSTPTNVMVAEAKVRLLRDRAALLARNFLIKNLKYGEREIQDRMEELMRRENYELYRQPTNNRSIITEAWSRVKWLERRIGRRRKFEIFEEEYETITNKIEVNINIGEYRYKVDSSDSGLIRRIEEKYNIGKNAIIIYTDGSKKKRTASPQGQAL